jgi:predicted tellurium resistance membrane protein TerC
MSLDNVLAVAGNAEHNYAILMIGLILSILLMVTLSGWIANLLDRYPSIQWLGLFVILFTALKMLEVGFGKVSEPTVFGIPESSIFMLLLIIIVGGFAVLQARYLKTDHSRFAEWAGKNGKILMVSIFLLLIVTMNFGGQISAFVDKHHEYQYGFIMICVLGILEILRIEKDSEKHNLLRRLFSKGE